MNTDAETLRSALLEVDLLRSREARSRRENELLVRILTQLKSRAEPAAIIEGLLQSISAGLGADAAVLVSVDRATGSAVITHSDQSRLVGANWEAGTALFRKPRNFLNLDPLETGHPWPASVREYCSWISPEAVELPDTLEVVACLSRRKDFAGPDEQVLLRRAADLVSQAINAVRLETRNIALSDVLWGATGSDERSLGFDLDPGFAAINSAFRSLARAQELIVEILGDLLRVPTSQIDIEVQRSLERTGDALRLDCVCFYELTEGGQLENRYDWHSVSSNRTPQVAGASQLLSAFPGLSHGETCLLSDLKCKGGLEALVAALGHEPEGEVLFVPLMSHTGFFGLVSFTSLPAREFFLPGEIALLRSVASVVGSLMRRKAAERAMEQSQAELHIQSSRLRSTLDALPDLVVELDEEGRLTSFYSDRMSSLIDHPASYIGSRPQDVLPGKAADSIHSALSAVRASGETSSAEFKLWLKGREHWFKFSASARRFGAGKSGDGFLAVIRDITAEREQIQEIERLSSIAERTSNLVIVTNANREIIWANEAFERRTGYRLDEVLGRRPGDLLQGPETCRETIEQMRAALDAHRPIQCEILNYDRRGVPYWVDMDIQPTRDAKRQLTGYMAVQIDITERRQRLDQLMQSERQARENLAAATDASRDGIAVTDAEGRFVYMNTAHQEMFAIGSEEQILGQHWSVLYSADKVEFINQSVFPILASKGGWKGEITGRRFDGAWIEQEVSLTLKADGGIVCITRDIGDRLRAETERTRLREALQIAQRREALSQMAAGLAHDFNNLIASISGSATLIESEVLGPANEHARRILLASQRASELVRRLLARGVRIPDRRAARLEGILREAADLLRSGLKSGTLLTLDIADRGLEFEVDPTDILQVLLNLGVNARDALPKDAAHPEIRLAARAATPDDVSAQPAVGVINPSTEYIVIEVSDNGIGMDAAHCEKVFQPYFTTKGDGGNGLGLVMVSSIVDANSGAIVLDSQPGCGTRIRILWPKYSVTSPGQVHAAEFVAGAVRLAGRRVLLVDDNEDLLDVLTVFLEKVGAEVAAVSDPTIALESIEEDPQAWDLLVTDFDMPFINGADLARQIKKENKHLPVILMTGLPDWRSRSFVGSDKLFERIVAKPIAPEELVAVVAAALGRDTE